MLTVDKSRKNNQIYVNHKLTGGGIYLLNKEINDSRLLISFSKTANNN